MLDPLRDPREGKHSLFMDIPVNQRKHVSISLILFLSGGEVQYLGPLSPQPESMLLTYFLYHPT